ncbi:hypothetical protein LCGC14_2023650 [marine sediment metagenome]|uniref:Uncharacterized protein n=1 Tax=marine sediment metagenome TaxID=412755 RepID=A0A0F9HTV0_9ZZZZ
MINIEDILGAAMAKKVDADMWWMTLEEHWKTFIRTEVVWVVMKAMKPYWMPDRLWQWLHNIKGG